MIPHMCPACKGGCDITFYPCKACKGTGIIWE
ncbi:unnamed protein product, partial [marine sediment metagenome]